MTAEETFRLLSEGLQADDELRAYILVDAAMADPMDYEMAAIERCVVHPISINHVGTFQHAEKTWPKLIQWRPQAVLTLRKSWFIALEEQSSPNAEQANGFSIGGWLLSTEKPEALVRHLRNIALVYTCPGMEVVRWGDRRLLEWMWPALRNDQRDMLLGPIQTWITVDRHGELVYRHRAGEWMASQGARLWMNGDRQPGRLRLAQLSGEMIRSWHHAKPATSGDYVATVRELMNRASADLHIVRHEDFAMLAAFSALVHPRLLWHPTVVEMIEEALREQRPLPQVFAAIPDPDGWDRIRAELNNSYVV